MKNIYLAAIPGDGIGKEVVPAALRVLRSIEEREGDDARGDGSHYCKFEKSIAIKMESRNCHSPGALTPSLARCSLISV